MVQVVTNENMLEFIEKRAVPEFKVPDSSTEPPPAAKPADSSSVAAPEPPKTEQPRGDDGKFVKADGSKDDVKEAAKAADDDDGAGLPADLKQKIDRIVAKKHRAMKEAEEFGRDEYNARRAAESRAEALQREIDALKAPKSGPASEGDDKEPDPNDFKTVGEYTKAYAKYEVAKALKAERERSEQQRQQQSVETVKAEFGKRVATAMKEIPDYEEVVSAADVDVPAHVSQYIVESEMGPLLGYHLAKHGEELDRIKSLSPIRAIAELGKLETKLEKKPEPPAAEPAKAAAQTVSRAPAPITPIEGKSTTVEKDPSKMTFQELRAYRMAERRAKGR